MFENQLNYPFNGEEHIDFFQSPGSLINEENQPDIFMISKSWFL
jgi:hypothetical protein